MKNCLLFAAVLFSFVTHAQVPFDDFEGNGNITSWFGDDCGINTSLSNPHINAENTSATVLEYNDIGGQYANVRFDAASNFDLTQNNAFSIKIYVPSSGITGNQNNQVSLKLQDGTLPQPWTTQTEIIKPLVLDQWQDIVFDFENDAYLNLDAGSPVPIQRTDLNRVLIQVNGENNNDLVVAYIDDVTHFYNNPYPNDPVYDNLVWSDEFDVDGALDNTKWHHQFLLPNGNSWYNGEIQHYTSRIDNSYVSNGIMYLVAKEETYTSQGVTKDYTSARLNSKFAFTYGRVEIRAKLPFGVGTWPAMWMLGQNIIETGAYWTTQGFGTTNWPACGEIDIMEHWGHNQNYVQSAMHTPSSFGATVNHGGQTIPTVSTEFHIYTVDWFPDRMVFKVDGVTHYVYEPDVQNLDTWPFIANQYILLNTAILPSIVGTGFTESAMEVDYVRVYQESTMSVDEFDANNMISLYPNPVKDALSIQTLSPIKKLQIVDLKGRLIKEKDFSTNLNNQLHYDITFLNEGLYVVEVTFENGTTATQKFIKE
ncbi:MAG: family 16 glycosylhydrolase [Winogradskyella sp.]|uniref:family 16 glycosylhydrolase n=1 Tax=Winogradskyella sp. TaxID=1883156 RepID=UPI0025F6B0E3|nr:family 16 glycosylhydrolase [Winogradskyella sp.]NRB59191.1 family 16 glycosylhydrolase [Winogradskyella sp.]